jgi:TPR repeat protein
MENSNKVDLASNPWLDRLKPGALFKFSLECPTTVRLSFTVSFTRNRDRTPFVALQGLALCIGLFAPIASSESTDIERIKANAAKGSIEQEIALGSAFMNGSGIEKDQRQAVYWYQKAADAGSPVAESEVGYFYATGLGVPRDTVRALHWFQLAADGGLTSAKLALGTAYLWGIGVRRDPQQAKSIFQEAVRRRSGLAACYLGDMSYRGFGVSQNQTEAERWYRLGTKFHDPEAAYRLASLLASKNSNNKNLVTVVGLLRRSAGQGYVPSMYTLGMLLVYHPDFSKSDQEATEFLGQSSNAGDWNASMVLGIMARDGIKQTVNDPNAYYYFRIAVLQGGETAVDLLDSDLRVLSKKIGPQQKVVIDQKAHQWFDKHHERLEFAGHNSNRKSDSAGSIFAFQQDPGNDPTLTTSIFADNGVR